MKILFCIGGLRKGGAERVISNLANSFSSTDEISIVITEKKIEYKLENNIKVYSLDYNLSKNNIINKFLKIYNLYKTIKEDKPDVIVSFLREPTFRVLLLRKFIKTPIIVSVRNDPKIEYKSFKSNFLMKVLYPLADGFVFQTEDAKQYFAKKIQEKSIIIPNPIKKEFLNKNIYTGDRDKIIVSVGRLEVQKNHNLLIDAFYDINDQIRDYKLIIYGEGSLRTMLQKKINSYGMKDRILLPGITNNIIDKIEKAKLFILSSNYEGMPNALMEAMALGIPSISTDCPCRRS